MGGRPPDVSDMEILEAIYSHADPVLSTKEVSEQVEIGEQGTYQRLKVLEEEGLIESKRIGRAIAWWLTIEGKKTMKEVKDDS